MSISTTPSGITVGIVGCSHGELDAMYATVAHIERTTGKTIDVLLCCGDFQACRNAYDLDCMSVPQKYRSICSYYKYYSGEARAPVLTIYIGGNHEAANHHVELQHGGWVAPNIYFMGAANVLRYGSLRIGGLSGIYHDRDYHLGHHECPPFDESTKRSQYHVREYDVWRMKQLSSDEPRIDIMLSHDWPRGIAHHGDTQELLRRKKFLRQEVSDNSLGNPPAEQLLYQLQPAYWFSAHLHVKFPAVVHHKPKPTTSSSSTSSSSSSSTSTSTSTAPRDTRFLALDKCLPHRDYLQIIHFPNAERGDGRLHYDPEWLSIVRATASTASIQRRQYKLPQNISKEAIASARDWIDQYVPSLVIPSNFVATVPAYSVGNPHARPAHIGYTVNPQTVEFVDKIGIHDVWLNTWGQGQVHQLSESKAAALTTAVSSSQPLKSLFNILSSFTQSVMSSATAVASATFPSINTADASSESTTSSSSSSSSSTSTSTSSTSAPISISPSAAPTSTSTSTGPSVNPDEIDLDDIE